MYFARVIQVAFALLLTANVCAGVPDCLLSFATLSASDLNDGLITDTYRALLEAHTAKLGLAELTELEGTGNPFSLSETEGRDLLLPARHLAEFRRLLESKGWDTPKVRGQLIVAVRDRIAVLREAVVKQERDNWDELELVLKYEKRDPHSIQFRFLSPSENRTLAWGVATPADGKEAELMVFTLGADGRTPTRQTLPPALAAGGAFLVPSPDGKSLLVSGRGGIFYKVPWTETNPDWSRAVSAGAVSPTTGPALLTRDSHPAVQSVVIGTGEGRLVSLIENHDRKLEERPRLKTPLEKDLVEHPHDLAVYDPASGTVKVKKLEFTTPHEWAIKLFSIPDQNKVLVATMRDGPGQKIPAVMLRETTIGPGGEWGELKRVNSWFVSDGSFPKFVHLAPGGKHFVTVTGSENDLRLIGYDLSTEKVTPLWKESLNKHGMIRHWMTMTPDGRHAAMRTVEGGQFVLKWIDLETGKTTFQTPLPPVDGEMFLSDDEARYYIAAGNFVKVVNLKRRFRQ